METPTKVFSSKISHTQSAYTQCHPAREVPLRSLMMFSGGGKTRCPLTWCRAENKFRCREVSERRSNSTSSGGQILGKRQTHPLSSLPCAQKQRTLHTLMSTPCFLGVFLHLQTTLELSLLAWEAKTEKNKVVDCCLALECSVSSSPKENKSLYSLCQSKEKKSLNKS